MFHVEHIGLAALDPEKLREWYQQVLGARLLLTIAQNPPAFLLELGGTTIEIYSAQSRNDSVADNRSSGWRHLALKVDAIEKAQAALVQRGVIFDGEIKPAGGGGRVLFFQDCEGNLLHLVERLPGGLK